MSRRNEQALLNDMVDAAKTAATTVAGKGVEMLQADYVQALGLVKCLEIVGEAAANIGQEFRDANPDVPWGAIIGMRNRLVHAYYEISEELLWRTLTEDLPPFIAKIEKLLETK